jgi:hypothetical protein
LTRLAKAVLFDLRRNQRLACFDACSGSDDSDPARLCSLGVTIILHHDLRATLWSEAFTRRQTGL